jgi:hypothetical protein
MDHIVYLDYKAKELENLKKGEKTMIIRGAMGRKMPYGRVKVGDILYFIENKGDGMIKAKAQVQEVFESDQMSREESVKLVEEHNKSLMLNKNMISRFAGKRYIILITIADFNEVMPFRINRSAYGNMDDWLPVGEIGKVIV